ncbi:MULTISPECIES: hypothetical protein [unclassified Mammaliicoccus]|uniref:hypothetical protein n=1 Tax=unclassified Mammaliicoccus TaxID=2803851 RepID=UPI001EFB66A5|nr:MULTISPECIES: hypothetical protein [unclassified Mammaliicoccus]
MKQYIEFRDYEDDRMNRERTAVESLNEFKMEFPSAKVVGYNTQVYFNANNKERTFILVEYEVD